MTTRAPGALLAPGNDGQGVELTVNAWPRGRRVGEGFDSTDGVGLGVFGQYERYDDRRVSAGGLQAFAGPFGFEIGQEWARSESEEARFLRFAPFFTFGFVSASKRMPAFKADKELAPTSGWVIHVKIPVEVTPR